MEMCYNLCRMAGTITSVVFLAALAARFIALQAKYPLGYGPARQEIWEEWESSLGLDRVREWRGWEVFDRYVPRWWVSVLGLAIVLGGMHQVRSLFDRITEYNISSISLADIAGTWVDGGRTLRLNLDGTATYDGRPDAHITRWRVENSTVVLDDPQGRRLAWRLIRFNGKLRISDDHPWFGQPLAALGFARRE